MERSVITADNVERLLEEENYEFSDDEFLSSDDGEVDHISDYVCSKSDSEDVPLTSSTNYFLSQNKSVCLSFSPVGHSAGSCYSQRRSCNPRSITVCKPAMWLRYRFVYAVSMSTTHGHSL